MIHGPRGAFRWTAYTLAATSFAAAIPTPLYPLYEQRLHFSAGVLGLAFAAYTPGVFLTLFFVAPHAEQLGRRNLLYVGMAFTILAAIVFESATDVLWLALARFIAGFAVGATTSVATAAMSDLEPYRDQHHVARVAVAANFGGFAIGATLSGFLAEVRSGPNAARLPASGRREPGRRSGDRRHARNGVRDPLAPRLPRPARLRSGGSSAAVLGCGRWDRGVLLDLRLLRRAHSVVRPRRAPYLEPPRGRGGRGVDVRDGGDRPARDLPDPRSSGLTGRIPAHDRHARGPRY